MVARDRIEIGGSCAISWDTQIMDTDIHKIFFDQQRVNEDAPVKIGNRVWVCSGAKIGKGVKGKDNTIIASDAPITKSIKSGDCIVTWMPIRMLRSGVQWEV